MKMHHLFFSRTRRALLPLFVAALFIQVTHADRHERLIDTWQPTHFDIALTLNDQLSQISTARADVSVLIRKKNLAVIDFDFGTMRVSSVKVDGETARFSQRGEKLDVYLPREMAIWRMLDISIVYSGTPRDGLTLVKDKDGLPSAIGD